MFDVDVVFDMLTFDTGFQFIPFVLIYANPCNEEMVSHA